MNIKGKPLTDTLGELQNGQFLGEATEEIYNVIAAVMETRKAGSLTIKLDFKPTGRDVVSVAATFSSKKPEEGRPETTFFVAADGSLQRKDPKQQDLPLREVEMPGRGELRTVGGAQD